jgi:pimeloyl-ACP methyl ester carboxylesterase
LSRVAVSGQVERFEHRGGALIDEQLAGPGSTHLVFLHGWGGTRDSLRGIGILFQHTHQVHLIDLPGFGDAPAPPPDWDTIAYTDLVQQYLLDHVRGPAVLIGHSFGGKLAVRLAARHLAQVRGIVVMASPGLPAPTWSRSRLRRTAIRLLRRGLVLAAPLTGPAPVEWHTRRFGSKDYLAAGALRPLLVRSVNEDLTESARSVPCPALLLWGTEDRDTPTWLATRYLALMPGRATLELLPHKDHHLNTGTGAHLCAFKIRSWLAAHAGA